MTKLCKDCRHYTAANAQVFDQCTNPAVGQLDLVRGETPAMYCGILRAEGGTCGRDGKLHEPTP